MIAELVRVWGRDLAGISNPTSSNVNHVRSSIEWIKAAQDATRDGGVSALFSAVTGWRQSYPETTGYLIPTMFNYADLTGDRDSRRRAIRMTNWLSDIQQRNGSFIGGPIDRQLGPLVFDTGQIIVGLTKAYIETGKTIYLASAKRAGDFLVRHQNDNGAWIEFSHNGVIHSYHTRVAWALHQLFEATGIDEYRETGEKNVEFVLSLQNENGWFRECSFERNGLPLTHTIAYTIRGILEYGDAHNNREYVRAAAKAADKLAAIFSKMKHLSATYNRHWKSTDHSSCLTGNAQMSVIWLRLFQITGRSHYLRVARTMNHLLKKTQIRNTRSSQIKGGIKGSHPFNGTYGPYTFPNWAAKFFIDALILEDRITRDRSEG